jgi:Plasmid pRiA4b ORF-3-like protein
MKKKRATSSLRAVDEIDQAVHQLFSDPPDSPMDFRLRVMRLDPDRMRTALARLLIEAQLAPVDCLFLVQWLIELEPGNAAIALLDLVSDSTKSLERRVPAFLLLTNSVPRELSRRMLSLPPEESEKLVEAAAAWLGQLEQDEEAKPAARQPRPRKAKARRPRAQAPGLFRLKVTLRGIRPPVWRRIEVAADTTFARLHAILQTAFDWDGSHLHVFHAGGEEIGVPDPEWNAAIANEKTIRLRDVAGRGIERLTYEYDFGDSWIHDIVIERAAHAQPGVLLPRCLAGKRACPPEDCGGVGGYAQLLEALADPDHPEHGNLRSWAGAFNPEAFDLELTDKNLRSRRG